MNPLNLFSTPGLTKEQKQPYCDNLQGFGLFEKEVWSESMVVLSGVSSLAMLFIAYTVFYNPHLRQHPADLIGATFFIFAFSTWMALSLYTICPLNGEVIFAATVYYDTSETSLMKAMSTLSKSYLFFTYYAMNIPCVLEICLL